MIHNTTKRLLSSILRPLALAVPVFACAAALSGCDDGDAPRPADGEAWIVEQLEAVRDLTAQEQAQHFTAVADDLEVAHANVKPLPDAPELDLVSADEAPESDLAPSPLCHSMTGCVAWTAQDGCLLAEYCLVWCDGEYSCYIVSGTGY